MSLRDIDFYFVSFLETFKNAVLEEYFIYYLISSSVRHLLRTRALENHIYNFLILCFFFFPSFITSSYQHVLNKVSSEFLSFP